MITLREAETISEKDVSELIEQLKECARRADMTSGAVNRPEWRAANIIHNLVFGKTRGYL